MKKVNTKVLWISALISFLLGIGLVFLVTFTEGFWNKVVIILIAVVFLYTTIAIQVASGRTFKFKPKPINYPTKEYNINSDIEKTLKNNSYKLRKFDFGNSYLKVKDNVAYKVVVIKDIEKYFNQGSNDNEKQQPNQDLAKCQKFIGIELFYDYDQDTINKLPDFCLQGDKVYYSAYYLEDNSLVCLNFVEPNEGFKDIYKNIINDLNLND